MNSLDWWFRQEYHLPPTDPRYLDMTREQILVEFWSHYLMRRRTVAREQNQPAERLEDLLADLTPEEKLATVDRVLEAEADELGESSDLEEVLRFRAEGEE